MNNFDPEYLENVLLKKKTKREKEDRMDRLNNIVNSVAGGSSSGRPTPTASSPDSLPEDSDEDRTPRMDIQKVTVTMPPLTNASPDEDEED